MASRFEGGPIVVNADNSETAKIVGGRQILDFNNVRHSPHELAALGRVLNFASGPKGELDGVKYTARLEGPGRVSVSPPLSPIARSALQVYSTGPTARVNSCQIVRF